MPEWNKFKWVLVFVFVAWLGCMTYAVWGPGNMGDRGQLGDVFGTVNALFSGLAFTGLIYTVLLQRNELLLQREELKLQREEMARSREALTDQASIQAHQLKAAIARIKVSAKEAELQALRMRFETSSATYKSEVIRQVEAVSIEISAFAAELETANS